MEGTIGPACGPQRARSEVTGRRIASRVSSARRGGPPRGAPPWAAILALCAFALRGLIPFGFEPADGALSLVLCPAGFPAHFFSHGRAAPTGHAGGGTRDAHCLFCNASPPAPGFALPVLAGASPVALGLVPLLQSSPQPVRLAHGPQARAPPHLL